MVASAVFGGRRDGGDAKVCIPKQAPIEIAIAVGIVFVVLCLGLYTLWRGGDTARSWSNKLMRIRVLAQFIAIIIIMTVLYFSQHN